MYSVTCLSLYIMCVLNVIVCCLFLTLLSAICGKMGVGFSEGVHILRPRYSCRTKDRDVLMNFLFGQATLLMRCNRLQGWLTLSSCLSDWDE